MSREAILDKMNNSRREQVMNWRKAGLTYAAIGRRLGITKERVRQILTEQRIAKKKPARSNPDALLSTGEAAELLNMHVNTIRRWSNKGILRAYRVGPRGDRRIRQRDINNLLLKKSSADISQSHN